MRQWLNVVHDGRASLCLCGCLRAYLPLLLHIVVDEVGAEYPEQEAQRPDGVQQGGVIHLDKHYGEGLVTYTDEKGEEINIIYIYI